MKSIISTLKTIKHLLVNLRKMFLLAWEMDKWLVSGYYLSTAIAAVMTILTSFTLKYLIDNLVVSQNLLLSTTTSIPIIIIFVLAARYVVNLISNLSSWTFQQVYFDYLLRYKLQNYISYKFYKKLSQLDIAHLENPDTQNLITKARDTMLWRLPDMLRHFSYFFSNVVSTVATVIILLPFGLWIPIAVLLSTIPLLFLRARYGSIQWSIWGSGAPESRKLWYFTYLLSTPTAIREMKIFKSADELLKKLDATQEYIFKLNKKPLDNYVRILTFPPIVETLVLFFIAYSQLSQVLGGILTIGSFTLLINMIDNLNGQAASAVLNFGEMYTHGLFVDHYFDVLQLRRLIKEREAPHIFEKVVPPKIEFKNVSFCYPNGHKVLTNVSFVINPKENVAFVGENGAGKSTIIKLLCRFYDVTAGEILINGVNIKSLQLSQWYEFLGTLFQDFVQYHFTVKENISLGNPNKKNEAAIKEAATKSGAYEFIKDLPKGFDTLLGREFERGEELSIGQWQKLAIARAFYEEAPVLILDEPTSAIDAEAEYEIFTNLEKAYKDKTLILVSHRFSTVRNAHKIFVVEQGKISEQGTHEELLKLKGRYAQMFNIQAKGYQ